MNIIDPISLTRVLDQLDPRLNPPSSSYDPATDLLQRKRIVDVLLAILVDDFANYYRSKAINILCNIESERGKLAAKAE